jgi:hypothetical protein
LFRMAGIYQLDDCFLFDDEQTILNGPLISIKHILLKTDPPFYSLARAHPM